MTSEAEILAALSLCHDPEVNLNIVDLGLVYDIELTPDPASNAAWPRQRLTLRMTFTEPSCPHSEFMLEQIRNLLAGIPDISQTRIDLVWEPRWTAHRISQKGREFLGL